MFLFQIQQDKGRTPSDVPDQSVRSYKTLHNTLRYPLFVKPTKLQMQLEMVKTHSHNLLLPKSREERFLQLLSYFRAYLPQDSIAQYRIPYFLPNICNKQKYNLQKSHIIRMNKLRTILLQSLRQLLLKCGEKPFRFAPIYVNVPYFVRKMVQVPTPQPSRLILKERPVLIPNRRLFTKRVPMFASKNVYQPRVVFRGNVVNREIPRGRVIPIPKCVASAPRIVIRHVKVPVFIRVPVKSRIVPQVCKSVARPVKFPVYIRIPVPIPVEAKGKYPYRSIITNPQDDEARVQKINVFVRQPIRKVFAPKTKIVRTPIIQRIPIPVYNTDKQTIQLPIYQTSLSKLSRTPLYMSQSKKPQNTYSATNPIPMSIQQFHTNQCPKPQIFIRETKVFVPIIQQKPVYIKVPIVVPCRCKLSRPIKIPIPCHTTRGIIKKLFVPSPQPTKVVIKKIPVLLPTSRYVVKQIPVYINNVRYPKQGTQIPLRVDIPVLRMHLLNCQRELKFLVENRKPFVYNSINRPVYEKVPVFIPVKNAIVPKIVEKPALLPVRSQMFRRAYVSKSLVPLCKVKLLHDQLVYYKTKYRALRKSLYKYFSRAKTVESVPVVPLPLMHLMKNFDFSTIPFSHAISLSNHDIMFVVSLYRVFKNTQEALHNCMSAILTQTLSHTQNKNFNAYRQRHFQEKETAESQINFLNSIIVDMQRKNQEQKARIEILESGYSGSMVDDLHLYVDTVNAMMVLCNIMFQRGSQTETTDSTKIIL